MAKFKITTEDGTFQVEADTPQDALDAIDHASSQNYMGPTDKNGVPEGMVYDKATNRMVDAKALANKEVPEGSWAGAAIKGMPFLGQYADELTGYLTSSNDTQNHPNESQAIQTEVARQAQKTYEDKNPKTALASKIAVGLTTVPIAAEALPAIPLSLGLMGRTVASSVLGGTTGALEGAVSGYGAGEDKVNPDGTTTNNRLDSAKSGAKWGGATGAILGAAAPAVSDAASWLVQKGKDMFTVNQNLKDLGLSRPAADTLRDIATADDTLGQAGMARLKNSGEDAMIADAGPTASGLLDTAVQKSGEAGRIADMAVEKRAAEAAGKLNGTMDLLFGKSVGTDSAAQKIYKDSAAARSAAYDLSYSKPIDYSTKAGRDIEDVFLRTPDSVLGPAIRRANDMMKMSRRANDQIMASIADDGTVTLKEMPNVIQADFLKRALNRIADEATDNRGIMNETGVDIAGLAKDLRTALADAVPEYAAASKLGGDTIEERKALELGYNMLRPSTTRESVISGVDGISDAERKQLFVGLRRYIDDMTANVTKAASDPNLDAREAAKAWKDMSSRAAREKLTAALGEDRAKILFGQLDKAEAAITLRANVADNSKTFARTQADQSVKDRVNGDTVINRLLEGKPINATQTAVQKFTGMDAAGKQARESEVWADIASALTGPRGQDAQAALQRLLDAYKVGDLNQQQAQVIGKYLTGGALLPSYQLVTQPK